MIRRPPAGYVRIGRLGRSFKLSGGVRLHLDNSGALGAESDEDIQQPTDPTGGALLDALGRLFVPGLGDTRLRDHETVSGSIIVYLEGVRDRTAARNLVNAEVWADVAEVPAAVIDELTAPTAEEELVGLPVTVDGAALGSVGTAHLGGANDYVEVVLAAGGTVLVPLAAPYVTVSESGIDLQDPPPGLLPD
jgi:ribosomal 30S subunit maturation factor RimM